MAEDQNGTKLRVSNDLPCITTTINVSIETVEAGPNDQAFI